LKQKVVILGSGGMAGHVISLSLKQHQDLYNVVNVARKKSVLEPEYIMDLLDTAVLQKLLEAEDPDIVINAAGILNQTAEQFPDYAIFINSYLPHYLERITANTNCRVIQISTDCVFSGKKGGYIENDEKDGVGYYAETKALGELNNKKDLTIRTSIIGPDLNTNGIGLFNWFAKQKGEISGYTKAYWTGVTTIELALAIIHLIKENKNGLYHLVNEEKIAKYDLLELFKKNFPDVAVTCINPVDQYVVDKSLVNTRTDISYKVPSYDTMVEQMKEWIRKNDALYPHYWFLEKEQ